MILIHFRILTYGKVFDFFFSGKKKRDKKLNKLDIQIVSAEPTDKSNDCVTESSGSSRTVSMHSDTSNNRASFISQTSSYNSISSEDEYEEDSPDTEVLDKSYQAAKEILTTERTYNKSLNLLFKFQKFILKSSVDEYSNELIVPKNEFIKIFSNLFSLKSLSDAFCKDFQKRIEGWEESPLIADILAKNGPFLGIYYQYTEEYSENGVNLEKLKDKYPKFKKAVQDFEGKPECGNLKISSFFLNPVQRLPRYKLLLENYLKRLEESDLDYANAVKALDVVAKAAARVNDTMAQNQNFKDLMELQSRFTNISDSLIQPHRSLRYKGKAVKMTKVYGIYRFAGTFCYAKSST